MTKKQRYPYLILMVILGGLLGYAYWFYYGCENGCSIQSVWWRMSIWGMVFAFFSGQILLDLIEKIKTKKK